MVSMITMVGYKSMPDYLLRLVLPVFATTLIFFLITFFFVNVHIAVPFVLIAIGLIFVVAYPVVVYEKMKVNIHENIHLFITYAGTISTLDLDRATFFRKIAHDQNYGYISKTAEKIVYLSRDWNLGFARTCRQVALLSPSKIFGDFLDRFAAIMDFGGDLETFLSNEQDAVMDDYASEYKQSLENISMIREVFIAITISIAFAMSTALLMPLLMGISILIAIQFSLLALVIVDIALVILVKSFIPRDDLCSKLKQKDEGTKRIYKSFFFIMPLSIIFITALFYYSNLPFLVNFAIGITPLTIVGFYASKEENDVYARDKAFPAFIRAVGSTIYARQGGVVGSIGALRVHDFGVLNDMMINLYRRLKTGNDKEKCWHYFAAETGSNLINYFLKIFSEAIYLGGHSEKIGQIISKNFLKLISLRKLRVQQASALRGALYGSLVGFVGTIYITVGITELLAKMFGNAFSSTSLEGNMGGLVGSIIVPVPELDLALVGIYLGIIIIIHSFVSSMILKIIDGGNRFAFLFDFTIMIWLGAAISWVVPIVTSGLFAPALAAV